MTPTIATRLAAILADPLASAPASGNALAYVGMDVPPDLGLAAARPFCHLPWRSGRATPWADQWLEAAFPEWARSLLEDWAAGAFDCFEAVIFSRGDDAAQRLYYYVCELQRRGRLAGPRALILDLALVPRESSVRHCRLALARLLDELGIAPQDLARGIEAANLRRRWYAELLRSAALTGTLLENLTRALLFQDLYEDLYEDLGSVLPPPREDRPRPLLLGGSAPPDDSLHRAVEETGWTVRAELHARSLGRYGPPIEDYGSDPLLALARHINGSAYGPRSFQDRAVLLEQEIKKAGVAAVLLWLSEHDEGPAWDLRRQRAVLESLGLPALLLTRRRWDGSDGAPEEIKRFLEEIGL